MKVIIERYMFLNALHQLIVIKMSPTGVLLQSK